ncbi:hypothetical protein ACFQZI_03925 [Mucilaginibacter lutimaris]|uniref:Uncharacterized protein n=1 Tax=Mucilaginibacter lutimaris TaxID=931629 RepID=A0ABW2ZCT3_9SPHI
MTITINPQTEQEYQALVTFLNANGYDYQVDHVTQLPGNQIPPINLDETPETRAARDAERDNRGPRKLF